jgi:hypothetical protein
MKRLSLFLLFTLLSIPTAAQQPDSIQREAISQLNWLAGQWKGEGFAEYRPGQRSYVNMTETIEPRLNGTVLLIEGLGRRRLADAPEGEIVHNAMAVVSYDEKAKKYRWQAWRIPGGSYIDTDLTVGDQTLEWSMTTPQGGTTRFVIKLNEKGEWRETGEYAPDNKSWNKFFEMTLRKVK